MTLINMKWLVCGGRDFGEIDRYHQHHEPNNWLIRKQEKEFTFIWSNLDNLLEERKTYITTCDSLKLPTVEVISGMARGVDSVAVNWADAYGLKCHKFPAEWDKYGKKAGYIRNKQMLEEGKPDLVIAFPGGRGTQMMVDLARKANVEIIVINYKENNNNDVS